MRYCGIAVGAEFQHLCTLEEVRAPEPPIRLGATFFEPGRVAQVVAQIRSMGEVVVAIAAPRTIGKRECDADLRGRGIAPHRPVDAGRELFEALSDLGIYQPDADGGSGPVDEGAYQDAAVFETNLDGVFCALQGRRVPARRHPMGVHLRVQELVDDHVTDDGDEDALWSRRIEEIDAAGAALCAHRYAVGHASWVGDPGECVIVLPGRSLPERFSPEGVLPPLRREPLPGGDAA